MADYQEIGIKWKEVSAWFQSMGCLKGFMYAVLGMGLKGFLSAVLGTGLKGFLYAVLQEGGGGGGGD